MRRRTTLTILSGLTAAVLGLLYMTYTFGPTEDEVVTWGQIVFYVGLVMAVLSLIARHASGSTLNRALRAILIFAASGIAFLQGPLILLWLLARSSTLSDGSPSSPYVAHWFYAVPHIAVGALCLGATYQLFRRETTKDI